MRAEVLRDVVIFIWSVAIGRDTARQTLSNQPSKSRIKTNALFLDLGTRLELLFQEIGL